MITHVDIVNSVNNLSGKSSIFKFIKLFFAERVRCFNVRTQMTKLDIKDIELVVGEMFNEVKCEVVIYIIETL